VRILVNAANTIGGGSVQKAVDFVRSSLVRDGGHRFAYTLSRVVTENLTALDRTAGLDLTTFDASPARPLAGRGTRRALLEIERRFRPDVVYSIFGPAYVRFRSPHLMGFAVGWVTHANPHAWRAFPSLPSRALHWAWCRHVAFWTRYADQWVVEARVAADGLSRVLGVPRDRIHVVPNTYSEPYARARDTGVLPNPRMAREHPSDVHLLVFTRWYPHKNLELVPPVAAALRRRDPARRYRFFLTFDTSSSHWRRIHREAQRLGVDDRVVNLGPVPVAEGPGLFAAADGVFLPTLLETYTATYPEAMCSRRPIVTTDLPFARDICGDAALYAPPNDAEGAAEQIARLAGSEAVRDELVLRGEARLRDGITPMQAYDRFLGIIEAMAARPAHHAEPVAADVAGRR
jgi:glycosyltransferase involved in cell wall biosynthesis